MNRVKKKGKRLDSDYGLHSFRADCRSCILTYGPVGMTLRQCAESLILQC